MTEDGLKAKRFRTWRDGLPSLGYLPERAERRRLAEAQPSLVRRDCHVAADAHLIKVRAYEGYRCMPWREIRSAVPTSDGLVIVGRGRRRLLLPWAPELDNLAELVWRVAWHRDRGRRAPLSDAALSPAEPAHTDVGPSAGLSLAGSPADDLATGLVDED